jgi:hypothetical protein
MGRLVASLLRRGDGGNVGWDAVFGGGESGRRSGMGKGMGGLRRSGIVERRSLRSEFQGDEGVKMWISRRGVLREWSWFGMRRWIGKVCERVLGG